jgi:hypothetical protein
VQSRAISSQADQGWSEGSTTRSIQLDQLCSSHERAAVRTCSKCRMEKEIDEVHIGSVWCKPCVSEYGKAIYQKKREKIVARKKEYRKENKEKVALALKKWAQENAEKVREYQKVYRKSYYKLPEKVAMRNLDAATRRFAQRRATPKWANKKAMLEVYKEAKRLTKESGTEYHVDHIVPLLGRNVCGLHTEHNLQILSAIENSRKNNKLIDEIV